MKSVPETPGARRKALGRGLDALLGAKKPAATPIPAPVPAAPAEPPALPEGIDGQVRRVPLSLIVVNPEQPRTEFDPAALEELAASIRVEGVIQPILVRPNGDRYLLVAGERRLRASKLAGLDSIPALVRGVEDDRLLEIALVENIQREDLNPIEIAAALQRLAQVGQLSHEELAQRTGKDRSTVTNLLRLLRLPSEVRALVADKRLSMGHARALLALPDEESQRKLALRAAERGLSVREVERLVRDATAPPKPKPEKEIDPNVAAAVESMERRLGTRVRLVGRSGRKGRIEIDYNSPEELDRIYALLSGEGE